MQIVFLTAIGVGLSTFIGSLISFFIKKINHRQNDAILSFAAGIMLSASFFSLIIPSIELADNILIPIIGIFAGALSITVIDKFLPHLHKITGVEAKGKTDKILLFLIAIAIHNFPEGMAVGVSFGVENIGNAISIAVGIGLQNIPEGMITVLPLVMAGVSKKRALLIALMTGLSEVLGVLLGYFASNLSDIVLPFILSAAAGTMLYVIGNDMIPETHSHSYEKTATFSLLAGIAAMILVDSFF